jgi:hypothetical protein
MRRHFPEAMVSGYEELIDQMDNDPKDRHVLAAAVVAGAEFIVTANLRDFPARALEPRAVEATGKAGRPKLTIGDVLDGLAGCRVVRFGYRVDAELSGRA